MYIYILILLLLLLTILLLIKIFNKDKFYNITDTNYKTYYFNNRGFAQLCNKKLDIIGSDSDKYFDTNYFSNLKDFDKVFLTTNMFKNFIKKVNLNKKIIIILHCSDTGFPNEFSKKDKIDYIKLIENNKNIYKLYCCNYDLKQDHLKIKPIPLGIDYHYLSNKLSPLEQEQKLISIYKNSVPFEKRLDLSYSFFHFQMLNRHNKDRFVAKNVLDNVNFNVYQDKKIPREETWKNMVNYKWIISPHGNGLDCHRTYEAIALGCIPVVKSSTLDIMYKDMPIIILNDWKEISLELLKSKTEVALKKSKEIITLNYWNNNINGYLINSKNLLFYKLKSNKPFAFGHFNDGEINCIINIQNTPRGQKCDNYIKNKLLNSLEVAKKYPNDCILGIPCSKCHYKEFKFIDNYIKKNNKILGVCIHHLKYVNDSVDKLFDIITKNFINIILVSNKKHNLTKFKTKYNIKNLKHIPVGDNFYEININTNELLYNLDNNTIVLFACGMGGRILAFEWFNINNKCTYFNIGSICDDVFLNIKLGYEDGKHKYCEECYPFKK